MSNTIKSPQNLSVTANEIYDAIVTKLRVQFIRRASIPFSLPDFEIIIIITVIVLSELWI